MKRGGAQAAILGLAVALTLAVLYSVAPESGLYPACPFRSLTGLLCPGCGGTRALHALLHGQVSTALDLNPLVTLAAAPALAFACTQCYALWRYGKLRSVRVPRAMQTAAAVMVAAFWLFRMAL